MNKQQGKLIIYLILVLGRWLINRCVRMWTSECVWRPSIWLNPVHRKVAGFVIIIFNLLWSSEFSRSLVSRLVRCWWRRRRRFKSGNICDESIALFRGVPRLVEIRKRKPFVRQSLERKTSRTFTHDHARVGRRRKFQRVIRSFHGLQTTWFAEFSSANNPLVNGRNDIRSIIEGGRTASSRTRMERSGIRRTSIRRC